MSQFGINNTVDKANYENQYRATLAQILGGIAIGMGLYYTWRRITIAENELKVSQQGQITERFTRAVDQLGALDQFGNPAIEIRLGGIYALERISMESDKDYWPIMEILTAYVRKNSHVEIIESKKITHLAMDIQANESVKNEAPEVRSILLDIQAVLTVLGRRKYSFYDGELNRLNLQKTCLQDANLENAHLERAELWNTHLEGAHFWNAHLEEAYLLHAHLEKADFLNAHLEGTILVNAYLKGAILVNTYLKGAVLLDAHLEGANLMNAHLKGANDLTIIQLSKVKTLYNAELDSELEKPLREKCPDLFEKPD